jgi:hypothetical protein
MEARVELIDNSEQIVLALSCLYGVAKDRIRRSLGHVARGLHCADEQSHPSRCRITFGPLDLK